MYQELLKWLAVIELPIFAGLFKLGLKHKKEFDVHMEKNKDALNDFKLHVARNYVSTAYLKDIEQRLTDHLIRIEKKLDYASKKNARG